MGGSWVSATQNTGATKVVILPSLNHQCSFLDPSTFLAWRLPYTSYFIYPAQYLAIDCYMSLPYPVQRLLHMFRPFIVNNVTGLCTLSVWRQLMNTIWCLYICWAIQWECDCSYNKMRDCADSYFEQPKATNSIMCNLGYYRAILFQEHFLFETH